MQDQTQIFGIRAIIEAINAGETIDKVFLQKGLRGELFTELESLLRKNKSAFLLYSLIDVIIDQSMTNIKEIEEHLNELEDLALDAKLEDGKIVYTYRREINYIRNSISPFFEIAPFKIKF